MDSGPRPFSFSIPTLTRVSIEADPVILPIEGTGPVKESSSKAEENVRNSGDFNAKNKIKTPPTPVYVFFYSNNNKK